MKIFPRPVTTAAILLCLFAGYSFGAEDPKVRLTQRLSKVDQLLEKYVKDGRIAGAVALVLRDGEPIYERAVGWRDREAQQPIDMQTIFRIASQTKAITSAAILLLAEEKKLSVHDEVAKYIPAFARTRVAVRRPNSTEVDIFPAKRPITIHHLLTHTSGISYGMQVEIADLYRAKELGPALGTPWNFTARNEPICDAMERLAMVPFFGQPGEGWVYGYSTDVLGCIVEKVSKKTLDQFIRQRITGPLGMKDTYFYLPPTERNRLAVVYGSVKDVKNGKEAKDVKDFKAQRSAAQGFYVDGPRKCFSGGAGLVSTVQDYAKFLEMIRNGGQLGDVRILKPETIQLMTTTQTAVSSRGLGFSYAFETTDRIGANGSESLGSYGWSGAYGTFYRVDPQQRLTILLMTQMLPNATDIKEKFWQATYKALADAKSFR